MAREERDAFLHKRALDKAIKNNAEVSKEMEKTRKAEEQTSAFQKLRTTMKDQQHGALNGVETPNGKGGWNTIFEAERMCQTLIKRNKKHFAQANDTLFADTDRGQHLGRTGTGMIANSAVDGTCACKLEELETEVREWLKELRRPKHMPDINVAISLEDCMKGFKKCKEQTASSPSGCHFGHCKTMTQDDELATLCTIMINLPT